MKRFVYFLIFFTLFFLTENRNNVMVLYANEKFSIFSLNLPPELNYRNLIESIILEDINGDELCDLIFFTGINIYIYEQDKIGGFSKYTKLSSGFPGAIDIGNVISGNNKEIIIMHKDGISYFKKEDEKWNSLPIMLIKENTIYDQTNNRNLEREYFAIDLDEDSISELILWGKKSIYIYYRDKNKYKLMQSIPYEYKKHVVSPGIVIVNSPLKLRIGETSSERIFKSEWPNNLKYIYFSTTKISNVYLIRDFNKDLKKDFIHIKPVEKYDSRKGKYIIYEYHIYFLNDKKQFSREPDIIISDEHGAWISPICEDIDNDGFSDLLKIETKVKKGLVRKAKTTLLLYLANKDGSYSNEPSQSIETAYFPLLNNVLIDINGDRKKDLILIHPISRGFSFGAILNKYLQKGLDAEIWVLPFRESYGFSRKVMLKKVKINFMLGIPINLSGDFNGDGMKDLLLIDGSKIKIFPLIDLNKGYSKRPQFNFKIKGLRNYIIKDINKNGKSDLIVFSDTHMKIIFF